MAGKMGDLLFGTYSDIYNSHPNRYRERTQILY
jgi:hypothetical protein